MRKSLIVIAAALVGLTAVGCSGSKPSLSPSTVTVTSHSTATSESAAPAATSWTMPDLIGQNLQAAQDAIQALTDNAIFVTTSTDLTGKGRQQVMDRNWQVCTSTPAAGTTITKDSKIDFGVVKLGSETCP